LEQCRGTEIAIGNAFRRYDFDKATQFLGDTWWSSEAPTERVSQRLRCYAPADLRRLLAAVGLSMQELLPGGAYDHERAIYVDDVPVEEAMSNTAVIRSSR
jgi:hypothetical protein